MKTIAVTGCAGFIGSNLVDRLLQCGCKVIGVDNLSTGQIEFLRDALKSQNFKFIQFDLLKENGLANVFNGVDLVFHLSANADVRYGKDHPRRDLEQNTIVTYNVLEAIRTNKIPAIAFASTGSVYGESSEIPTSEGAPFPIQTSLYGASKAACEGLITAYSEAFGIKSFIFRFVSILGERYTHGHIFDFYKKLQHDQTRLEVLGNGSQKKSYLYVQDCIDAMMLAIEKSQEKINIYNLGVDDYCEVNQSIDWICKQLGVKPVLSYAGGERGWVGDNPFIYLATKKIRSLGWEPRFSIQEGVIKTVEYLKANEWVFNTRK